MPTTAVEAAAAESAHAKLQAQSRQMATQLSVLRRKLEQKEQIENAIEGKHNKLTEVYKSSESECQVELQRCKSHLAGGGEHGAHEEAVPPPPEQQQQQQRARVLEALPQPCSATANGGGSSSSGLLFGEEHQLRLLLRHCRWRARWLGGAIAWQGAQWGQPTFRSAARARGVRSMAGCPTRIA